MSTKYLSASKNAASVCLPITSFDISKAGFAFRTEKTFHSIALKPWCVYVYAYYPEMMLVFEYVFVKTGDSIDGEFMFVKIGDSCCWLRPSPMFFILWRRKVPNRIVTKPHNSVTICDASCKSQPCSCHQNIREKSLDYQPSRIRGLIRKNFVTTSIWYGHEFRPHTLTWKYGRLLESYLKHNHTGNDGESYEHDIVNWRYNNHVEGV